VDNAGWDPIYCDRTSRLRWCLAAAALLFTTAGGKFRILDVYAGSMIGGVAVPNLLHHSMGTYWRYNISRGHCLFLGNVVVLCPLCATHGDESIHCKHVAVDLRPDDHAAAAWRNCTGETLKNVRVMHLPTLTAARDRRMEMRKTAVDQ